MKTPSKDRKVVIYSTCFVNFNKKNTGVAALKVLKKKWCRSSRGLSWLLWDAIFRASRSAKSC